MNKKDDWKNRTCETCIYSSDFECRRFPPHHTLLSDAYPGIKGLFCGYYKACKEYEER